MTTLYLSPKGKPIVVTDKLVVQVVLLYALFFLPAFAPISAWYTTPTCLLFVLRLAFFGLYGSEDGFCFEEVTGFTGLPRYPTARRLAAYCEKEGVYLRVKEVRPGVWHPCKSGELVWDIPPDDLVGSAEQFAILEAEYRRASFAVGSGSQRVATIAARVPPRNALASTLTDMYTEVRSEAAFPRLSRAGRRHVLATGEDNADRGHAVRRWRKIDTVSALEASRLINTTNEVLGHEDVRSDNAVALMSQAIPTSVQPTAPAYAKLTAMLGPLAYRPRIEGHREAATLRRAALVHMSEVLVGAVVGLVSPSHAEVHAFPNGCYWFYDDGVLDQARRRKNCTLCKAPTCALVASARLDSRCLDGSNRATAASFFARFSVNALCLVNVEPNLSSVDLLDLMDKSGVSTAYSLTTLDWRALVVPQAYDELVGMTTTEVGGKIVSSFNDAGDYVQDLEHARALFAPCSYGGKSLRRTVIFGEGATQYFEVTLSNSSIATRCVPGHSEYYFIRIPLPGRTRPTILVERKGMDRVLATFRTQAVMDLTTAKIVLRQSNVTYSISGTQVTPRLRLTATEAEGLAVWVVVYSKVQDTLAAGAMSAMTPSGTTSSVSRAVWTGVTERLAASTGGQMALGSMSAVEAVLNAYRRDMTEASLDELSKSAMAEIFGPKLDFADACVSFAQKWASAWKWASSIKDMVRAVPARIVTGWRTAFTYVDAAVLAGLLGVRFCAETIGVVADFAVLCGRMVGSVPPSVQQFQARFAWATTKSEKVWVGVQKAQQLDFQAACIDIVETFFNTFANDPSLEFLEKAENGAVDQATLRDLVEMSAMPYSDFLSELKTFLGSFNVRTSRWCAAHNILSNLRATREKCSDAQLAAMVHVLQAAVKDERSSVPSDDMVFALGSKLITELIPLEPIRGAGMVYQEVREFFQERKVLTFPACGEVVSTLERLSVVGGKVDFSPIHFLMEEQHPGGNVAVASFAGPTVISPDEKGAKLQEKLLQHAVSTVAGTIFATKDAVENWYAQQFEAPNQIAPVTKILRGALGLSTAEPQAKWIAHIDGLAFGGKSAGVREWIRATDLVVVPTNKLKLEWQEKLGKKDPVFRASVVTQHQALETKYAARYVIVDEAYTLDPEHLQMIANRHARCAGVITIGDGHQISNVFTPSGRTLDPTLAPCKMAACVSFLKWDALVVYLATNSSPVRAERYFCGSEGADGLTYVLSASEIVVPGSQDLAVQGTQKAKEVMKSRGNADTFTSHETQGARSRNTVVHCSGEAMNRDCFWLSRPEQAKHLGVTISRAHDKTVFVVDAVRDLRVFPWVAHSIEGELSTTCIFSGTAWDFCDPRTEDEVVVEHVWEDPLVETHLNEPVLTDPVSVGTVFCGNEALSSSEIRTTVVVDEGVKLRDDGEPHSDLFDHYTIQPRDVPGSDKVQALMRRCMDVRPTNADHANAQRIVSYIFDEVIDKKKFFAHLANSKRCVLNRRSRDQAIDGCYAEYETRMSTISFAFLKPEFSKKPSSFTDGEQDELKAQGVVTASAMQQGIFADVCDALTHAWARSMQPGKYSPVGMKEDEMAGILATFDKSYELDIEKQDSSHRAVHVLVAAEFLRFASDKLGLDTLANEIRTQRSVKMMNGPFSFILSLALASGDPWTLIINKIMAVSSVVSIASLDGVRMAQSGDDVTFDREPKWRDPKKIRSQAMANAGVRWKVEEREQRKAGVTFLSRAVLQGKTLVYKALRTILKYAWRKRTRLQHAGIFSDAKRILAISAHRGLQAYCEARCQVWGGDPVVVFDMWTRGLKVAQTKFDDLPEHLRDDREVTHVIKSKEVGCFGYALANCVGTNVQAVNAIASYPRGVTTGVAIQACIDNGVPYVKLDEKWASRSKERLRQQLDTFSDGRKNLIVLYNDHAVAVVPNHIVIHGAFGKKTVEWRTLKGSGFEEQNYTM